MFPFLLSFLPLTFLLFCKSFRTSEDLFKKSMLSKRSWWVSGGQAVCSRGSILLQSPVIATFSKKVTVSLSASNLGKITNLQAT